MSTSPKTPRKKVRPYTKDLITRQPNGGNYMIQFRVPAHMSDKEPFTGKETFRKSLKTKDRREALALRDAFLEKHGYFALQREAERRHAARDMKPTDFYFEALNSVEGTADELAIAAEELEHMRREVVELTGRSDHKKALQFAAQRAALLRRMEDESSPSPVGVERPHAYTVDLQTAAKAYQD